MRAHKKGVCFIVMAIVLMLASVTPVAAQEGEVLPCVGENVAGTVVEVDVGTGTVTIDTGVGRCTVTLDGEYDHPIVELLGSHFGDVSHESLSEALEATQGCATFDEASQTYVWADCEDDGTVPATIVGKNEDGSFTFKVIVGDQEVPGTVNFDPGVAAELNAALDTLTVDWNVDEYGAVVQPGDEIAAYHDDGLGFGVIVKLYAMAAQAEAACAEFEELCDVTVAGLVSDFESGVGIGELFKLYGKPALLGVGHVRHYDHSPSGHFRPSERIRVSAKAIKPDYAGPKAKTTASSGKPDHAGPKPKTIKNNGKPDHAGPKPKPAKHQGKPDHAGPKPKDKGK
jgi:hypothetical protein